MVAAEGDDARQCFAVLGGTDLASIGGGLAREDVVVALLDLVEGICVIVTWYLASVVRSSFMCEKAELTMSLGYHHSPAQSPSC